MLLSKIHHSKVWLHVSNKATMKLIQDNLHMYPLVNWDQWMLLQIASSMSHQLMKWRNAQLQRVTSSLKTPQLHHSSLIPLTIGYSLSFKLAARLRKIWKEMKHYLLLNMEVIIKQQTQICIIKFKILLRTNSQLIANTTTIIFSIVMILSGIITGTT